MINVYLKKKTKLEVQNEKSTLRFIVALRDGRPCRVHFKFKSFKFSKSYLCLNKKSLFLTLIEIPY